VYTYIHMYSHLSFWSSISNDSISPHCERTCHPTTCVPWLIDMCATTHSHVWHDSFICVTWLIHVCAAIQSYVFYDSSICAMTHSYVLWFIHMCHDSLICVTSRIDILNPHVCICIKKKARIHSQTYLDGISAGSVNQKTSYWVAKTRRMW